MVEPLRHRQTKGAETDMPGLPPLRHTSTLPTCAVRRSHREGLFRGRKTNSTSISALHDGVAAHREEFEFERAGAVLALLL